MNRIQTIGFIGILIIMVLLMSSCNGLKKDKLSSDSISAINERIAVNIKQIERLESSGIITADRAQHLKDTFNNVGASITEGLKNDKNITDMNTAISKCWDEGANALGVGAVIKRFASNGVEKELGIDANEPDGADLNVKVYRLKSSNVPIDTIVNKVHIIITTEDKDKKRELINELFEEAKDANGNVPNMFNDDGSGSFPSMYRISDNISGNGDDVNNSEIKYDFLVRSVIENAQTGEQEIVPAFSIKLKEMNPDFVDMVCGATSATDSRYIIFEGKALCLEYPVSVISNVEKNGDSFKFNYKVSPLILNIGSGEIKKNSKNNEYDSCETLGIGIPIEQKMNRVMFTMSSQWMEAVNNGYKLDNSSIWQGSGSAAYDYNSSFTQSNTLNTITMDSSITSGGTEYKSEYGFQYYTIILRDYLEFIQPDENSDFDTYGRRVRILRNVIRSNSFKLEDDVAVYVDNSGSNMFPNNSDKLKSNNAVQGKDLLGNVSTKDRKLKLTNGDQDESDDTVWKETKMNLNVQYPSKSLKVNNDAGEEIGSTGGYASGSAGDIFTNNKMIFYGLKISKDNYLTGLASWINKPDDKFNSYSWWKLWLASNEIDLDSNEEGTRGILEEDTLYNGDNSYVVLDADTISKIQEDLDNRKEQEKLGLFNNLQFILGVLVIIYGVSLPIFWLIDMNLSLGFSFITVVTFGHAVPIYGDEGDVGGSDIKPMSLKEALIAGFMSLLVGILLVNGLLIGVVEFIVSGVLNIGKVLWESIAR